MDVDECIKNKFLSLSQGEITALKKAIIYLKFSCEQPDSLLFAGSPLINSALDKLIETDDFGEQEKTFYSKKNDFHKTFIMLKIDRLDESENITTSDDLKINILKECLHPHPMD